MFLTSLHNRHLIWRINRRDKGVGYGYESPVINYRGHVECFSEAAQEKYKFIRLLIDQVASNKHLQCTQTHPYNPLIRNQFPFPQCTFPVHHTKYNPISISRRSSSKPIIIVALRIIQLYHLYPQILVFPIHQFTSTAYPCPYSHFLHPRISDNLKKRI